MRKIVSLIILFVVLNVTAVDAASFRDLQMEKRELEKRRATLQRDQRKIETEVQQLDERMARNVRELETLQREREQLQRQIRETEQTMLQQLQLLDSIQHDLDRVEALHTERKQMADDRARALQLYDQKFDVVSIMLGSATILDFFKRIDSVNYILEVDRDLMQTLREEGEYIEEEQAREQKTLRTIEEAKELLQIQRDFLAMQEERQRDIVNDLKARHAELTEEQRHITTKYDRDLARSKEIEEAIIDLWRRQPPPPVVTPSSSSSSPSTNRPAYVPPESISLTCTDDEISPRFHEKLNEAGKLAGQGPLMIQIANRHQIDPVIFAAITIHETGHGTSRAIREYNNPGGMMNPATNWSTLIRYSSLEAGLDATAKTISRLMNKGGLRTIEQLGAVYAPIGAANDPSNLNRHWAPNVKKFINELGGYACP